MSIDWTISEARKHQDAVAWIVAYLPVKGSSVVLARFTTKGAADEYARKHAGPRAVVIPPRSLDNNPKGAHPVGEV